MAKATNRDQLILGAATGRQVGQRATHVGLWSASTGGIWYKSQALAEPVIPLAENRRYVVPARAIEINIAEGDFNYAMILRMLRGAVLGSIYVSVHTASGGETGANEIGVARGAIRSNQWMFFQ